MKLLCEYYKVPKNCASGKSYFSFIIGALNGTFHQYVT